MHWIREGADWVLKFNRRKLGRVFPDDRYPGMWRSRRADGQLSDRANLTWAKHAVFAAAERDILPAAERAFSPPKPRQKRTFFESKSPYVAPIDQGADEVHRIRARTHKSRSMSNGWSNIRPIQQDGRPKNARRRPPWLA